MIYNYFYRVDQLVDVPKGAAVDEDPPFGDMPTTWQIDYDSEERQLAFFEELLKSTLH